jgi:chromosome segregation ATPase
MLYAGAAMGELHPGNGPLADSALADREVVEHRDYDEAAGELPEELPKGIVRRLEDLQRRLGRCEGRLERTRVSETLLREQLKRERQRADRLEAELREAEAELRVAEVERHKSRRGWFGRFFGMRAAKH